MDELDLLIDVLRPVGDGYKGHPTMSIACSSPHIRLKLDWEECVLLLGFLHDNLGGQPIERSANEHSGESSTLVYKHNNPDVEITTIGITLRVPLIELSVVRKGGRELAVWTGNEMNLGWQTLPEGGTDFVLDFRSILISDSRSESQSVHRKIIYPVGAVSTNARSVAGVRPPQLSFKWGIDASDRHTMFVNVNLPTGVFVDDFVGDFASFFFSAMDRSGETNLPDPPKSDVIDERPELQLAMNVSNGRFVLISDKTDLQCPAVVVTFNIGYEYSRFGSENEVKQITKIDCNDVQFFESTASNLVVTGKDSLISPCSFLMSQCRVDTLSAVSRKFSIEVCPIKLFISHRSYALAKKIGTLYSASDEEENVLQDDSAVTEGTESLPPSTQDSLDLKCKALTLLIEREVANNSSPILMFGMENLSLAWDRLKCGFSIVVDVDLVALHCDDVTGLHTAWIQQWPFHCELTRTDLAGDECLEYGESSKIEIDVRAVKTLKMNLTDLIVRDLLKTSAVWKSRDPMISYENVAQSVSMVSAPSQSVQADQSSLKPFFVFSFDVPEVQLSVARSNKLAGDQLLIRLTANSFKSFYSSFSSKYHGTLSLRSITVEDLHQPGGDRFRYLMSSSACPSQVPTDDSEDLIDFSYTHFRFKSGTDQLVAKFNTLSVQWNPETIAALSDFSNCLSDTSSPRVEVPTIPHSSESQDFDKMKVTATLKRLSISLNKESEDRSLVMLEMGNSVLDYSQSRAGTYVCNGVIGKLQVVDLSLTKSQIEELGDRLEDCRELLGNREEYGSILTFRMESFKRSDSSFSGHDALLTLQMNPIRVRYWQQLILELVDYFFQGILFSISPEEVPERRSSVVSADSLQSKIEKEMPNFIRFDIDVRNPFLMFPKSQLSDSGLLADLGRISVKTSSVFTDGYFMQKMDITASAMQLNDTDSTSEILKDVDLFVTVVQSLEVDYPKHPQMVVNSTIPKISVVLTKPQYNLLVDAWFDNFLAPNPHLDAPIASGTLPACPPPDTSARRHTTKISRDSTLLQPPKLVSSSSAPLFSSGSRGRVVYTYTDETAELISMLVKFRLDRVHVTIIENSEVPSSVISFGLLQLDNLTLDFERDQFLRCSTQILVESLIVEDTECPEELRPFRHVLSPLSEMAKAHELRHSSILDSELEICREAIIPRDTDVSDEKASQLDDPGGQKQPSEIPKKSLVECYILSHEGKSSTTVKLNFLSLVWIPSFYKKLIAHFSFDRPEESPPDTPENDSATPDYTLQLEVNGTRMMLLNDVLDPSTLAVVCSLDINYRMESSWLVRTSDTDPRRQHELTQLNMSRVAVFTCLANRVDPEAPVSRSIVEPCAVKVKSNSEKIFQTGSRKSLDTRLVREISVVLEPIAVKFTYEDYRLLSVIFRTLSLRPDGVESQETILQDDRSSSIVSERGIDMKSLDAEYFDVIEEEKHEKWKCNKCTFENSSNFSKCEMCESHRTSLVGDSSENLADGSGSVSRIKAISFVDFITLDCGTINVLFINDYGGRYMPLFDIFCDGSQMIVSGKDLVYGIDVKFPVRIDYYNPKIVQWEPLLEPITIDVHVDHKRIKASADDVSPTTAAEVSLRGVEDSKSQNDSTDLSQPKPVNVNITASCLESILDAQSTWATDVKQIGSGERNFSAYHIANEVGLDLFYWIGTDESKPCRLCPGETEMLQLGNMKLGSMQQSKHELDFVLSMQIGAEFAPIEELNCCKTKCFAHVMRTVQGASVGHVLMDTRLHHGSKVVTVRSPIEVQNRTLFTLEVRVSEYNITSPSSTNFEIIGQVEPGGRLAVPLNVVRWDFYSVRPVHISSQRVSLIRDELVDDDVKSICSDLESSYGITEDQGLPWKYEWSQCFSLQNLSTPQSVYRPVQLHCNPDSQSGQQRFHCHSQSTLPRKLNQLQVISFTSPVLIYNLFHTVIEYRIASNASKSVLTSGSIEAGQSGHVSCCTLDDDLCVSFLLPGFVWSKFFLIITHSKESLKQHWTRVMDISGESLLVCVETHVLREHGKNSTVTAACVEAGSIVRLYTNYRLVNRTELSLFFRSLKRALPGQQRFSKWILWQNFRREGSNWEKPFLASDLPYWCDDSGNYRPPETVLKPGVNWRWTSKWRVDMSCSNIDKHGFMYAKNFGEKWTNKARPQDFVRRRRWVRVCEPILEKEGKIRMYGGDTLDGEDALAVKTADSTWSQFFSPGSSSTDGVLRVLGDSPRGKQYDLAVRFALDENQRRTKRVVFEPRYRVRSRSSRLLFVKQAGTYDRSLILSPDEAETEENIPQSTTVDFSKNTPKDLRERNDSILGVPLYWADRSLPFRLCVSLDDRIWSGSFDVEVSSFSFRVDGQVIIRVQVHMVKATFIITLSEEPLDYPAYRIQNKCEFPIYFKQLISGKHFEREWPLSSLAAGQSAPYAWEELTMKKPYKLLLRFGDTLADIKLDTINSRHTVTSQGYCISLFVTTEGPTKVLIVSDSREGILFSEKEVPHTCIYLDCPTLGISLVDSSPKEIIYITALGNKLNLESSNLYSKLHYYLSGLQIDNQTHLPKFPLLLQDVTAFRSGKRIYFMEFKLVKSAHTSELHYFRYVGLLIQDFTLQLSEQFLSEMTDFFAELSKFRGSSNALEKSSSAHRSMLYFDMLDINAISARVSFVASPELHSLDSDNAVNTLFRTLGVLTKNVDAARLQLKGTRIYDTLLDSVELTQVLMEHYKKGLLTGAMSFLGSSKVLGNPAGLVSNISDGLHDFWAEPAKGLLKGPVEFGTGVAKGSYSLFRNTVTGVSSSVSGVSEAISQGLASLSADSEYIRSSAEKSARHKPEDLLEGLATGASRLGTGIFSGVTGIVMAPARGAKHGGASGFFKGIGQAAVGLVAKPLSGVAGAVSAVSSSVSSSLPGSGKKGRGRIRFSRMFYGEDQSLKRFNEFDAEIVETLRLIQRGRYMDHAYLGCFFYHRLHGGSPYPDRLCVILSFGLICLQFFGNLAEGIEPDFLWAVSWRGIASFEGSGCVFSIRSKSGREKDLFCEFKSAKRMKQVLKALKAFQSKYQT
eukprot:941506_1